MEAQDRQSTQQEIDLCMFIEAGIAPKPERRESPIEQWTRGFVAGAIIIGALCLLVLWKAGAL